MQRYDKYEPVDLENINQIPSGWTIKKLKYVAKLKSGESITSDEIDVDGDYPVYGGNGLRGFTSSFTHEGHYVLIGRQGALCGNINYATGKFFASEHAVVASILDNSEVIWLGELLRSLNLNQYSIASAQPGLSVERIQNLLIPVPPKETQLFIVNYLQKKIQQIVDLIRKKQQLIIALQEERATIINETISGKGKSWPEKKLKYVAQINRSRPSFQFDKKSDEQVVFLPMEKVSEHWLIDQETRKKISDVSSGFTYFERGDIIVAKITPCFENGKAALLSNLETDFGFGSTEFHTLTPSDAVIPEYLFFITRSERFMKIGEAFMTGSAGQKRVPSSFIENFVVGIPDKKEQQRIVNHINEETQKIDATISKIETEIQLIQEYRTALISEVVTGKIKVV